jgi:hypothetical protein
LVFPPERVGTKAGPWDYGPWWARIVGSNRFSAKETAMGVLIGILITFLVVILVLYLVNMLPIDGRAKQIVRVIVIIIGVLSLLKYLAVF